jgi:hypothetical protein
MPTTPYGHDEIGSQNQVYNIRTEAIQQPSRQDVCCLAILPCMRLLLRQRVNEIPSEALTVMVEASRKS